MREVQAFVDMGCVFVSIPKTATQSIWNSILADTHFRPFQHVHAKVIKAHFDRVTPGKWDDIFKFAVVRNPIELIVSWHTYHKNHPDIGLHVRSQYADDINEWIMQENFSTHWERPEHNRMNSWWDANVSPLHQHSWVTDDSGEQIVDCVLRQEQLSSEILKLGNNVKFHRPLERLNSTERAKIDPLSKDSILKITTTFSKDFKMFGYSTKN